MKRTRDLRILCPVCGHNNGYGWTDGCLINEDATAAICCRTVSTKKAGGAGWLHILKPDMELQAKASKPVRPRPPVDVNFRHLAATWQRELADRQDQQLLWEHRLQVSPYVLYKYGCGVDPSDGSLTIPISEWDGRIVGIQKRKPNGFKKNERGSKMGLIRPMYFNPTPPSLLICEGFSDTAFAHHLTNIPALGKLNCATGNKELVKLLSASTGTNIRVFIIADNDEVGIRGATDTALAICPYVETIKVLIPPAKDLREWSPAPNDLFKMIDSTPNF